MAGTANDEQLPLLAGVAEYGAAHPIRNDEIAVAVDDEHRSRQAPDSRNRVEMHARDELPQASEARNEHAPSHILRRRERRLEDERTWPRGARELSRNSAAERMPEQNEAVRRGAKGVAHEVECGIGVPSGAGIRGITGQTIIAAVFREDDAQFRAVDDRSGPRNEPARDVGVAVKGEHDRMRSGAVADYVREEAQTVRGRVLDTACVDRSRGGRNRRLKHDSLLEAPEQQEQGDISEPKADQEPRDQLRHSRSRQRSAGSSGETRRAI